MDRVVESPPSGSPETNAIGLSRVLIRIDCNGQRRGVAENASQMDMCQRLMI